ncbi:MAG: hypothetical protein CM1200mP35_08980 [Chloroflexota bacterium]|nr:MAG: hypothetical protein CM1200mP35_08980 [Chloroflexota bacterium]
MAGAKETFEIELNFDHRIFIKSVVEQYGMEVKTKLFGDHGFYPN